MTFLRRRPVRRKDISTIALAPSAPLNFVHPDRARSTAPSSGLDLTRPGNSGTPIPSSPVVPKAATPIVPTREVVAREPGSQLLLGQHTLSEVDPDLRIGGLQSGLGVLAAGLHDTTANLVCLWETIDGQRGLAVTGTISTGDRALVRVSGPSHSTAQPQPWLARFRELPSVGVNLRHVRQLRRLVFVATSTQSRDWSGADLELAIGQATIYAPAPAERGVVLALASATVIRGELLIYREDETFESEQELANAFGFPLHWATARTIR